MKKLNILFLPLLFLTNSSIYADDKLYSFIGIQTAASNFEDTATPTIGVKYGKQTENLRTAISYNYGEKSKNNYQTLIMQIDMGVLTRTFKESPIKPYIGASVGVMQQDDNSVVPSKDRGFIYGANVGMSYIFNDAIDLDLGYRFLKTSKLENINKINDLTFSMHYFY